MWRRGQRKNLPALPRFCMHPTWFKLAEEWRFVQHLLHVGAWWGALRLATGVQAHLPRELHQELAQAQMEHAEDHLRLPVLPCLQDIHHWSVQLASAASLALQATPTEREGYPINSESRLERLGAGECGSFQVCLLRVPLVQITFLRRSGRLWERP